MGGRNGSIANLRRFWAVAASANSSWAPVGPRSLSRSSFRMRFRWAIPPTHGDFKEGVSPSLSWSAVPGAKSYAIVMEDPDSKPVTPFVHWVAWNIPPAMNRLPEGLQTQPRLTEPEGMMQGRTSRGSVGYFGPRPPVGDSPHRYHFQVLALDTLLDVPPGATRDELLHAAKGHVLAKASLSVHISRSRSHSNRLQRDQRANLAGRNGGLSKLLRLT
jgi:Raf kinase inhibitor-like YbhB/YbcL family protein